MLCCDALAIEVAVFPTSAGTGSAVSVRATGAPTEPRIDIEGVEEAVPLVSCGDGCFEGITGVPRTAKAGTRHVRATAGKDRATARLKVVATKFPSEKLVVDRAKVELSKEDEARADAETALMRELYAQRSAASWAGPFIMPIDDKVTMAFGTRRLFNGKLRNTHTGMDIRGAAGTPVHAMNAGRVALCRELFFGGGTVILDHGQGIFSTYMHLSEMLVAEGQEISRGDVIGLVGATGRVTGPHLHLGFKVRGVDLDASSATRLFPARTGP